ncbi:MAG: nucleotide exchange factor GrpE [Elusimicrobiota bacterium]
MIFFFHNPRKKSNKTTKHCCLFSVAKGYTKMDEQKNNNSELEEICPKEKDEKKLLESVEEQKKKAQDYYEQMLRLKADFENYRKRSEREKREYFESGKNSLITELIDVFETVKLAKGMIEKSANGESVQQGLHLIEKKLLETLKQHDVVAITTMGEKYNPFFHEVVGVIENDDVEEGVILEEIKPGYKIGEKVLKPAMVKIAKKAGLSDKL